MTDQRYREGEAEEVPRPVADTVTIRAAGPADAFDVGNIYNHYVRETVVTFEEEQVSMAEIASRIEDVQSIQLPWLVAEERGQVVGYACATPWRPRTGYRFSAEITNYLDPRHLGRGIGSKLYAELLPMLKARRIHAVFGCIALPNEPSVSLHEKFGLRKVAHLEQIGFKHDRWIDVGYWQRLL
jgi:L-amino acid N-acyltransferase YncA